MRNTVLLLFILGISSFVYPQADGSFFTLQLGKQTCLFKYEERSATSKSLTLQGGAEKSIEIKYPWSRDTVTSIDPVTLKEETKIITNISPGYHIETEMTYFDFLLLLQSKFEIKNPQKKLHVSSYNIYYETKDTGGLIRVQYPERYEGVISKLNCLVNGGFVLLSLKSDDHNLVNIDTQGRFLALIHIKK